MASTAALALSSPRLQPTTVPPGPRRPARPDLRVIEGGRGSARRHRATYLRRRLVVLAVGVVLLVGLILSASAVMAGTAGSGGPSAAAGTSSAATHVVAPGDTLWSIAAAAAPDVDVRITVDRIAELNGRAPLVVGQRLVLPS